MKRFLAMLLSVIMGMSVMSSVVLADGVENYAVDLAKYKIVVGDPDGNMRYRDNLTRAEAATVVCRLIQLVVTDHKQITNDVDSSFWGYDYVNTAVIYEFVNELENGNFRPNDNITYAEFAKMIMTALGYAPQAEQMGSYPQGYIMSATRTGLFETLSVDTSAPVTRLDMMVILNNALDIPLMQQNGFGADVSYQIMDGNNGVAKITPRTNLEANGTVGETQDVSSGSAGKSYSSVTLNME